MRRELQFQKDNGERGMIAHCFFEQSGTFKNEFKKLGIEAYDYDILNDFGQTDFQIDLFAEIEKSYGGGVVGIRQDNTRRYYICVLSVYAV